MGLNKKWFERLFLSLSILLCVDLFAQERGSTMGIVLVPIGDVDRDVIEKLKNDLSTVFNMQVSIGKGMPEPEYAFNGKRNQYLSTAILRTIMKQKEYTHYKRILGIFDHDLCIPELNFVFGEANRKAAVISLTRLRQEFYGLPENRKLFYKRMLTEAVHELGHTYGLNHCKSPFCVMFFSNSLMDTDRKGSEFCPGCKSNLF
jgi:archaemetzincin